MEKNITTIKELVYAELTNRIATSSNSESIKKFQIGMLHLLGINTPIDFVKASHFFENASLENDSDTNALLGFIAELDGNYALSFQHYAKAGEESIKKNSSYIQKIIEGRDSLQKFLKKMTLPLKLNEVISQILGDCIKGNVKSKLNAKIILASISKDDTLCLDVAQELVESGDNYSAIILLQKGSVDKSNSLYNSIGSRLMESKDIFKPTKASVVELEGDSLLTNYDVSLSIPQINKECIETSKRCKKEWCSENKKSINKLVNNTKKKIEKEKIAKLRKRLKIIFYAVVPLIVFFVSYIWLEGIIVPLIIVFSYYYLCYKLFSGE